MAADLAFFGRWVLRQKSGAAPVTSILGLVTMTVLEAATLTIAVLGAVLGVINIWHQLDRTRVKLRVVPKRAIPYGGVDARLTFCMEITNLSAFAVTVEEVGVLYQGTDSRSAYTQPIVIDRGSWPRRLESRESVTVFGQPPSAKLGNPLKCAYARTACGVVRTGSSPAFRQMAADEVP